MTGKCIHIVVFLWLTGFCLSLQAQNLADTVILLREVRIKASIPVPEKGLVKTRVDSSAIQKAFNISLGELLSENTPVFIRSYGPGALSTVSFRGTASSHTRIVWNGIPLNSPLTGQADLSLVPVFLIDEINLFHGGSTLHEGPGALGGSIHLRTRTGWYEGFSGSAIQGIGSFDTYQSFLTLGGGNTKWQTNFRVFHQRSENDFTFYNDANGLWRYEKQKNADYAKTGAQGEVYMRTYSGGTVSVHAWIQESDRNLPPIMSYQGSERDENQKDRDLHLTASWIRHGEKFRSELITGFSHQDLRYRLANHTEGGILQNFDTQNEFEGLYNRHKLEIRISPETVFKSQVNYYFHRGTVTDHLKTGGFDVVRNELGATVSLHHAASSELTVFGLLREEYADREFTPFMPSAGFEWTVPGLQDLKLRSNVSAVYNIPSLNDLYWSPGGNPNLRPEKGTMADLSLEYRFARDSTFAFTARANTYASLIDDWIMWAPGKFRFWQADNIKKVFSRGLECMFTGNYLMRNMNLRLNAHYAYTRTTNQKNNQLIYIPLHKAGARFISTLGNNNFSYSFALTGKRFTAEGGETNRHSLPAYDLHNISAGRKFRVSGFRFHLEYTIRNLFNEDYQAVLWRAMPGRNHMFICKIKF